MHNIEKKNMSISGPAVLHRRMVGINHVSYIGPVLLCQHYPIRWHVVIGPMLARCRVANRWRTLVCSASAQRRVANRRRCQPIADVCRRRTDVPLLTGWLAKQAVCDGQELCQLKAPEWVFETLWVNCLYRYLAAAGKYTIGQSILAALPRTGQMRHRTTINPTICWPVPSWGTSVGLIQTVFGQFSEFCDISRHHQFKM